MDLNNNSVYAKYKARYALLGYRDESSMHQLFGSSLVQQAREKSQHPCGKCFGRNMFQVLWETERFLEEPLGAGF